MNGTLTNSEIDVFELRAGNYLMRVSGMKPMSFSKQ